MIKVIRYLSVFMLILSAAACVSVEDIAMNKAADILSSGSGGAGVFMNDDDPQLVADALPLALKLYEMILAETPEKPAMQLSTGKNFVMYANAFIQTPAGMLSDDDYEEAAAELKRAKKMYIRGKNYSIQSLELLHPGFTEALAGKAADTALSMIKNPDEADNLYWTAAGWIGAYSCDPFDFEMAAEIYMPVAMLIKALEINPEYSNGAVHDIFIQLYSSLPVSHLVKAAAAAPLNAGAFLESYYPKNVSSSQDKALFHFNESVRISGGTNPGTFNTYAQSVSVKNQDYEEYRELLEKALSIDPVNMPDNKLVITIYQQKAQWLLDHADDYFLLDFEEDYE